MTGALGRVRSAALAAGSSRHRWPSPPAPAAGTTTSRAARTTPTSRCPRAGTSTTRSRSSARSKGPCRRTRSTQRRDTTWTSVFDADPDPSLNHVASTAAELPGRAGHRPTALARSSPTARRSSRSATSSSTSTPRSTARLRHGQGYEPVELDGGFHGSHLVAKPADDKKAHAHRQPDRAARPGNVEGLRDQHRLLDRSVTTSTSQRSTP